MFHKEKLLISLNYFNSIERDFVKFIGYGFNRD